MVDLYKALQCETLSNSSLFRVGIQRGMAAWTKTARDADYWIHSYDEQVQYRAGFDLGYARVRTGAYWWKWFWEWLVR